MSAAPPPLREVVKNLGLVELANWHTPDVDDHVIRVSVEAILASAEFVALQQRVAALEAAINMAAIPTLLIFADRNEGARETVKHLRNTVRRATARALLTAASDSASEAGRGE